MPNTFEAVVQNIKEWKRGDKQLVIVNVVCEANRYPIYVDLEYPADERPIVSIGQSIKVEYRYLPTARGYLSKKINPNTGEPYVNATLVMYKAAIEGGSSSPAPAPEPELLDEDVPF